MLLLQGNSTLPSIRLSPERPSARLTNPKINVFNLQMFSELSVSVLSTCVDYLFVLVIYILYLQVFTGLPQAVHNYILLSLTGSQPKLFIFLVTPSHVATILSKAQCEIFWQWKKNSNEVSQCFGWLETHNFLLGVAMSLDLSCTKRRTLCRHLYDSGANSHGRWRGVVFTASRQIPGLKSVPHPPHQVNEAILGS